MLFFEDGQALLGELVTERVGIPRQPALLDLQVVDRIIPPECLLDVWQRLWYSRYLQVA